MKSPLSSIRVHLSGSIPDEATEADREGILGFVETFTKELIRRGGVLVHGSHLTIMPTLEKVGQDFVTTGQTDSLVLVRAKKYAESQADLKIIEGQRKWASVEIIPSKVGDPSEALMPMREWMAERSDVIVAIGGKWFHEARNRAGVPRELEEMFLRGKPGFLITAFGGASAGLANEDESIWTKLRNGLNIGDNKALSMQRDSEILANSILDQITRLPIVRGDYEGGRRFRILALDGGGMRGVFSASVLAGWAKLLKDDHLVRHFDLVAGTSTGAILAVGLALGKSPSDLVKLYQTNGDTIFPRRRLLRHLRRSKHDVQVLENVIASVFGQDRTLEEACCRLVIPSVDAKPGLAHFFTTPHEGRTEIVNAVKATIASAAAPTFFDAANVETQIANRKFLDGGMWANNPVVAAIAEAHWQLKIPLSRIDVLSIGTLHSEQDFSRLLGGGLIKWAKPVSELFLSAQESGAILMARALLSDARFLRINAPSNQKFGLDDTTPIEKLIEIGGRTSESSFENVRSRFLDGYPAKSWKPER